MAVSLAELLSFLTVLLLLGLSCCYADRCAAELCPSPRNHTFSKGFSSRNRDRSLSEPDVYMWILSASILLFPLFPPSLEGGRAAQGCGREDGVRPVLSETDVFAKLALQMGFSDLLLKVDASPCFLGLCFKRCSSTDASILCFLNLCCTAAFQQCCSD